MHAITGPQRPRVLLADDSADVLTAFAGLLAASCDVVGTVTDAGALIEHAERLYPDVVVLDLFMPPGNGLDVCRQLARDFPRTRVIIVSALEDVDIGTAAERAGAAAFVPKIRAADRLVAAIRRAVAMTP